MSAPENPFELGARRLIPAVLVYCRRGGSILMLHRNSKPGDFHAGKWNGLGGKMEPGEAPIETAAREVMEESGLQLKPSDFRVIGVLHFPDFKPSKCEDWMVYVLTADVDPGREVWARGPEGNLMWILDQDLDTLTLWEGDRKFLPLVLGNRPFVGTFWYGGGKLHRTWLQPL